MRRYRYNKRYTYRLFLVALLFGALGFSLSHFGGPLLARVGAVVGEARGASLPSSQGKPARRVASASNNNGFNVLIIGNNARNADNALSLGTAGGQADILIVAHVDSSTHQVTLISVPRDTLVAMPDWREPIPKIKSAFNLGLQTSPAEGADLAMKYVSQLTGMSINNYVAIDFQGFVDAVNAVHGITVDVPARLYDPLHSHADLYPGRQVLDGEEALAYVRIRQNEAGNNFRVNDFQRQKAELQVLDALKEKVYDSFTNISELTQLIGILNKDVDTNLNLRQIISLAEAARSWKLNYVYLGSDRDAMDIAGAPAPGLNSEGYLTGAYYDVLDPARVFAQLKAYGASGPGPTLPALPSPDGIAVEVYGPPAVASGLKKAGFQPVVYGGPADKTVTRLTIIYPPGELYQGLVVGRYSGSGNELVEPGPAGLQKVLYLVPG